MQNEIIKYYFGDFVTRLGRPHLVLVGQEFENELICEKLVLFEELNGTHSHIGQVVKAPKIQGHFDNIDSFMENQGLEQAKSIIYLESTKENQLSNNIFVNLRETNQTSFLFYLKSRSEEQLNWIENSTRSAKLKELVNFYKAVQITKEKYDK